MPKVVGGKKKLKFRTTENEKTTKRRLFLAAFIIVTLIIASVSIVVIINEYKPVGTQTDDPTDPALSTASQMKDYVTVMFSGVPTSEDDVTFISCITLDTKERKFIVTAVSPTQAHEGQTLSAVYASEGAEKLSIAVSAVTGIEIDRYAVVNEKKFKSFMAALGSFEINLAAGIDYQSTDFSLNLLSGPQTLTGDKLFKYIKYVGLGGSDYELENQAEVIGEIISQKLNETNTEKEDELFGTLINNCDSNITILDFSKYKVLLKEISAEPRVIEAQSAAERD